MSKVLGIGLSRTGTTSLDRALVTLGLDSAHFFFDLDRIDELDAATDVTVTRAYKELDRRHPGSRFILTVREEEAWLESCRRFFRSEPTHARVRRLRLDLYGTTVFDESLFRDAYRAHLRDVRRYFRRRRGDLLVLDVCAGEGWEELCPFLGRPVPDAVFPHQNRLRTSGLPRAEAPIAGPYGASRSSQETSPGPMRRAR